MSRLQRRRGDQGFTLIEVLVALAVLSVVAVAAVPLLATAGRAARSARFATQAKNLGQERIERMRNLPYYVDAVNGPFRDLFDTYYPRLTPAATGATVGTATTGYVSPTNTARVPGEPAAGAYFRVVSTVPGFADFRQIIATQFINALGNGVTPAATYTSTPTLPAQTGFDAPASGVAGVTVLTSYVKNGVQRPTRYYTRIIEGRPPTQVIVSQARTTAVGIISTTVTPAGGRLSLDGGAVSADGSRSIDSSASLEALGARGVSDTTLVQGAVKLMSAPPSRVENVSQVAEQSVGGGCAVMCFGRTDVSNTGVSVANGLPVAGTGSGPVEAEVRSNSGGFDFQFNNGVGSTLLLIGPMIRVIDGSSGINPVLRGRAYVNAAPTTVTSGGSASAQLIKLFPTGFATQGVVQVELTSASLDCTVTRSGGVVTRTVTPAFSAVVRYWFQPPTPAPTVENPTPSPPPGFYREVAVDATDSVDDLGAVSLDTMVSPTKRLRDYITTWSGLTGVTQTDQSTDLTKGVRASLDGVVSITTAPTRGIADPSSVIALKVASLACYAEDNR